MSVFEFSALEFLLENIRNLVPAFVRGTLDIMIAALVILITSLLVIIFTKEIQ